MSDSPPPATPAPPEPGERRLDRPPSDRYRETAAAAPDTGSGDETPPRRHSAGRRFVHAAAAALLGAVVTVALGGVLAISAGLLVVAVVTGRAIGLGLMIGDDGSLSRSRRIWIAIGLALASVVIGQLGLWWYASTEGGVLGPLDYLAQTFGILVPLQALLTVGIAWWTAR